MTQIAEKVKDKIQIVGLIYRSVSYLDFIVNQIEKYSPGVSYKFIANDATEAVLNRLKERNISHIDYKDPKPQENYLCKVYRAWNLAGQSCDKEIICLISSDMGLSPNWLENLYKHLDRDTLPVSRLVESGRMPSGRFGVSKCFGMNPKSYQEEAFVNYAKEISEDRIDSGGLYGPMMYYKDDFIKSGGYPEGNVMQNGNVIPGDIFFLSQNPIMKLKKHVTVFDSIVYHYQTGEMCE